MSLDQRIQEATTELHAGTHLDPVAGLADLHRTHRRRQLERVVATAAAILVVAGSWVLLGQPSTAPQPAPPTPQRVSNGLLVTHEVATGRVVVLDPSTGHRVAPDAVDAPPPGTSSDRTHVATAIDGALEVRGPEGRTTIPLPELRPGTPVWSPDGTRIAFAAPTGLYVVDADGTWLRSYWNPSPDLAVVAPSWSPDGAFLAYVAATPVLGGSGSAVYKLITIDVASNDFVKIAVMGTCVCDGRSPLSVAWSPDGRLVAFTGVGRHSGVFTVPAQGGTAERVSRERVGGTLSWRAAED